MPDFVCLFVLKHFREIPVFEYCQVIFLENKAKQNKNKGKKQNKNKGKKQNKNKGKKQNKNKNKQTPKKKKSEKKRKKERGRKTRKIWKSDLYTND